MVEDKKKTTTDAKAEGGGKKRMPAIILVAAGAMLGGAGVVVAVPPKQVEKVVEKPPPRILPIRPKETVEIAFNPQTEAGNGFASIKFRFEFETREDLEAEATKLVQDNWDRARHECLFMLGGRNRRDLRSDSGRRALTKELIDTLDNALFAGGERRIARVSAVWILDLMVQ